MRIILVFSENITQVRHSSGLGHAQFTVAIGVPVRHANGLDGVVGEGDGRAWDYLNDFLEVFPVVGGLVGTFGTSRHVESGIFAVVENTRSNRYWCWIFYGDGGQARAIAESLRAYARHAVGDGDGGQALATCESSLPYARHAVGDSSIYATRN